MKHIIAAFHEALVSLNYEVVEEGEQEPRSLKGNVLCKSTYRTINSLIFHASVEIWLYHYSG